ncbi:tetratricopeptide repeat protein [Picosynechococcus sp. NKBG15041c]|uniref:tetratricopeptide repeat protein n=1 Tax=Picosynechococcus sp. NKBG15041c TaxID=1407650 RepID=UPI000401874F|nr:tetratricopeptide repeat protein [Picosynechococcus sp. NKBG15041c]
MAESVVVNRENFATAVLAASQEKPVLVDFFATWCGPCQILKPLLQKLLQEYDFTLALVDIDQNPELAHEYGVEGVPDVRVVTQGKVIPGFVGVIAEAQIREILENLGVPSSLDGAIAQLKDLQTAGELAQAKTYLDELFSAYPKHPKVILAAAEFLLHCQKPEEASRLLNTIPPDQADYQAIAEQLRGKLFFQGIGQIEPSSDLDRKYIRAAQLALAENYEEALLIFLEIVAGDRRYQDDGGRKAMVAIFNLLGSTHPLTQKFQKQLMQTLY